MLKLIKNKWFQVFIILFLPFLAYLNILGNNFVWDDIGFIRDWDIPRSFSNFPQFLNGSAPIGFEGVYRPVKIILLSLNLHLFGNLNVFLFHFQGIILHMSITLLIFFIVRKLTSENMLALITALFFGLNPVHTEAVSWATASLDLFGILFIFIAYLIYLYSGRGRLRKLFICSLFFAILGYFSNELTFPFFLLLITTDYIFFGKKIKPFRKNLIYFWYFLPIILYFLIRFFILDLPARREFILSNLYPTMLVMAKTIVAYSKVLILPLNLNVIPTISPGITGAHADMNVLKAQTIFDPMVVLGILTLTFLIFIGIYFRKRHPIFSFSAFWMLIAFIPFSNIFPVGIYYSERYLYFASFGFCLGLGYIFFRLLNVKFQKIQNGKIVVFAILLILLFYFVRVVERNSNWSNSTTFWQTTLSESPDNPEIINNLGIEYMQNNNLKPAQDLFYRAIKINPNNATYYHNLGVLYGKKGDSVNNIRFLEKAHNLDKNNEFFAIKVAQFYYDNKNYNKLLDVLKITEFKDFKYIRHFFMGAVYLHKGNLDLAKKELNESIRLKNNDPWTYNELASVYMAENNLIEAEKILNEAIRIDPKFAKTYNNLAIVYASQNDFEKALSFVNKALELDPSNIEAQQTRDTIQKYFQQNLLQFLQQH